MSKKLKDENGKLQDVTIIDLEHHYATEKMWAETAKNEIITSTVDMEISPDMAKSHKTECDLDAVRIAEMNAAGIDFAQLSLTTPCSETFPINIGKEIATDANNKLAEAIKKHPDRIGGYMALVPEDVEWSLKEIDRCLKLGLWGWCTMSNYSGKSRLDDPKYLPILARCNELKMPIFIHPFFPTHIKEIMEVGYCLFGPNYGFTIDTQLTFLRMIYRGIFDKYPDLKIILGHNAEGLAIYADRVDTAFRQKMNDPIAAFGTVKHRPSYYLKHNLIGDTSGNFLPEVMHFTKNVFGNDFLAFGTDYPYEDAKACVDMIVNDKVLTFAEKKAILQDNAKAIGIGPKSSQNK